MKKYTLDQAKDKLIGKKGSPSREEYEFDLQMELIGMMIKKVRKDRSLTQEELGKLIGVKRAQISKLEKGSKNVTISTVLRVFEALETKVKFKLVVSQE